MTTQSRAHNAMQCRGMDGRVGDGLPMVAGLVSRVCLSERGKVMAAATTAVV